MKANHLALVSILATGLLLAGCGFKRQSVSVNDATVTYGYADSTPVVMVAPEDGLTITMHDVVYMTVNNIWVLGGYRVTVNSPSAGATEIELRDFEYDDNLSIASYYAILDTLTIGSRRNDFDENSVQNRVGLYPSGYDVALFIKLPCSIASSEQEQTQEQFFDIWVDHLAKQTVACQSGEMYVFDLGQFDYMSEPSLKPSQAALTVSVSK